MTRHWSWETPSDDYPRLFGEIAAALADRLNAPYVVFAASCVDEERLEQELRTAGFVVHPPPRKKRWIGTVSHGSLDAWRAVPRDDAARTPQPLWRAIDRIVYSYPAEDTSGPDRWSDVEALVRRHPYLVSHDADCVTVEAAPSLEQELIAEASAAAERVGGDIKELGRRAQRGRL